MRQLGYSPSPDGVWPVIKYQNVHRKNANTAGDALLYLQYRPLLNYRTKLEPGSGPNIVPMMHMQSLLGGVLLLLYLLIAMLNSCQGAWIHWLPQTTPQLHEREVSELNSTVGSHDGVCTSIILRPFHVRSEQNSAFN